MPTITKSLMTLLAEVESTLIHIDGSSVISYPTVYSGRKFVCQFPAWHGLQVGVAFLGLQIDSNGNGYLELYVVREGRYADPIADTWVTTITEISEFIESHVSFDAVDECIVVGRVS